MLKCRTVDDLPFLIFYDDPDRKPELLIGEDVARTRFAQVAASWNAHLFVKIASSAGDSEFRTRNATLASDDEKKTTS